MRTDQDIEQGTIVDPEEAAESAGLLYVSDEEPGIRRRKSGKGFSYRGRDGSVITDKRVLERIYRLAIPPAWTDVWICPSPNGHIQATGRDARGRKQYRYHPRWREVRDEHEVRAHDGVRGGASENPQADRRRSYRARAVARKVLATVVYLLENTLIRVGNADYASRTIALD